MSRSHFTEREGLFEFPNASFSFPSDALPNDSSAVVTVVWYKTLQSFLVDDILVECDVYDGIKSTIISATVTPQPKTPFKAPVRISWEAGKSVRKVAFLLPQFSYKW